MCVGAVGPKGTYANTKCYGEILAGSGITPTNDTLFWIGSVTKTMTATLLALRVNQGAVQLNDRVDKYLSSLYHIPQITLLQLADMESGLQRNPPNPYTHPMNETELYTDLQACVHNSTCWSGVNNYIYSNFGFGVLGSVLADHDSYSKWSLDNFYSVMAPLGMLDTKTPEDYTRAEDFSGRRAHGHTRVDGSWQEVTKLQTNNQPAGEGAGGLWTNASDMLIWLRSAAGVTTPGNGVQAALKMTMECRGPRGANSTCSSVKDCGSCTGLAWDEDIDPCTREIRISKGGAAPGFKAWIGFNSRTGRGVFVLLNSNAISPVTLGEKLLDMIP
jgi:CubicO group peptidase (beta-lactamase class C family)